MSLPADAAPGLVLRAAVRADVPRILDLIRALAEYEKLSHDCVATEDALAATLFGEHPAAEVVIAEYAGEAAGFALFFTSYSTFLARPGLYLEDLFVYPQRRGLGVGLALMRHLARLAVARGYGRFEWSVLDWNAPAIAFYRRLGAVPMDDWTVQRLSGAALAALAASAD